MSATPNFLALPFSAAAAISAANTARDGTGTIVDVTGASPAGGRRVSQIVIQATAATTAGMVRLFLHDGTNFRLWREVPVTAITPSATVAAFRQILDLVALGEELQLPVNWSLRAATNNAEAFNVIATGGVY
jgi:hypothetical protein